MRKIVNLSALAFVGLFANENQLEDAIKNGKFSGEIGGYFESRHINKGAKNRYYNDTAWLIGSAQLGYESGFYNNVKFSVALRGSAPIYEDDRHFRTLHGKGDASQRIYDGDEVQFSKLFFEYNAHDTVLRVGRQEMISDWHSKINDGIRVINKSVSNLTVDALWSMARGRVYLKEMWGVKRVNKDKGGIFNVNFTYKMDEFTIKNYHIYAHDAFYGMGAKLKYDTRLGDKFLLGAMVHYAATSERVKQDDGKIFESKIYAKYADTKLTLVHVRSGKKAGWGSLNMAGDQIVFFEEGDVLYERDAKTYYAMLSQKFNALTLQGMLGTTNYKLKDGDDKTYRQNELTARVGYDITSKFRVFGVYERTFKAQPRYPSLTQISAGVTYSF